MVNITQYKISFSSQTFDILQYLCRFVGSEVDILITLYNAMKIQ